VAKKEDNLKPGEYKLTIEEAKKGGIASGKARREKASFKKAVKWLLEESNIRITQGDIYEKYKEQGIDISMLTPSQLATIGLWAGAVIGKQENYKTLMEVNEEKVENAETPEININIIDNSSLEKELYREDKE
jgi:hypothetical protein